MVPDPRLCAPSRLVRPPEKEALEGSEWTLTDEIGESTLGGYGGCYWYSGSYDVSGDGLELGQVASTARACTAVGLTDQEARFHGALSRVRGHGVMDESWR